MYQELGVTPSAFAVANHYQDILTGFAFDAIDAAELENIERCRIIPLVTDVIMRDPKDRIRRQKNYFHSAKRSIPGDDNPMSLWAIVPVKPLRRGKSRLSEILSEEERAKLNHQLFIRTIEILKQVDAVSEILVVSRDSDVLTEARELDVRTVTETGRRS